MKNNDKYVWTNHVLGKMRYYGLSASRVIKVMNYPKRKETGVAPNTIASMQQSGSKKRPYEIWVMYQQKLKINDNKIIIISAWKYPGISPIKGKIPIPENIEIEIKEFLKAQFKKHSKEFK